MPSAMDLILLADVFEVSVDELISNISNKKNASEAIQSTPLYQKIKMIEDLDDRDRDTILNVIDSIITKNRMKDLLQTQL